MRLSQLICLTGAFALALNANTIVYSNINESSADSDGVDFVGPLYNSFAAQEGEITDLQLILSGEGDNSQGLLDVDLYADDSTAPGEFIATLGTIDDSVLSDSPAVYCVFRRCE